MPSRRMRLDAVIAAGLWVCAVGAIAGCTGGSDAEQAAHSVTVADADAADDALSPNDLIVTDDEEVVSGRPDEMAAPAVTDPTSEQASKPTSKPASKPADQTARELAAAKTTPRRAPPIGPPPAMPYDEMPVDDLDRSILAPVEELEPETPAPKTPTVQPGMESKTFERVGKAIRLSFDDLDLLKVLGVDKPIPLDVAESYPGWLKDLDGRRVRLRGFMYPPYEPDGIRKFALARDNEICCFGRDPLAYDILPVNLAEGVTTEYIQARPFDVIGTFHHDPFPSDVRDDDLMQLYSIDEATIEQ